MSYRRLPIFRFRPYKCPRKCFSLEFGVGDAHFAQLADDCRCFRRLFQAATSRVSSGDFKSLMNATAVPMALAAAALIGLAACATCSDCHICDYYESLRPPRRCCLRAFPPKFLGRPARRDASSLIAASLCNIGEFYGPIFGAPATPPRQDAECAWLLPELEAAAADAGLTCRHDVFATDDFAMRVIAGFSATPSSD